MPKLENLEVLLRNSVMTSILDLGDSEQVIINQNDQLNAKLFHFESVNGSVSTEIIHEEGVNSVHT